MCDLQLSSFVMARVLAFEINTINVFSSVQFSRSVVSNSLRPHESQHAKASLSITNSRSSLRLTSIQSVMPSSHLILCCPLLFLPPIPPSIRVFSNESTLHMRLWGTKKPLDESERGEWKSWLKTQHSEKDDHGVWSHHFMANRWGNSVRLYIWGLHSHCRWWLQPWKWKMLTPWKESYDQPR